MKKRGWSGKRGQGVFGMSFGMIFSIILIIFILAAAFFVIRNFLNLSECADTGLFYDDLQNEVDKAWKSSFYQDIFEVKLPSRITYVCFGGLEKETASAGEREKRDELKSEHGSNSDNVFLYPNSKACDSRLASYNLTHVDIEKFFCIPESGGKLSVKLEKGSFDALVKVMR